jgi:hypothetical protein
LRLAAAVPFVAARWTLAAFAARSINARDRRESRRSTLASTDHFFSGSL